MTKQEFIAKAAAETKGYGRPLTQADMETALHTLCNVASAELLDGGEISLPGLGKLKIKEVPARQGRNPRTGEAMELPASRKVVFSMSKTLKETMNP